MKRIRHGLFAAPAIAVSAATIWVTGAFGAGSGGPSSSSTLTDDGPVAQFVQETPATPVEDCPEHDGAAPDSGSGSDDGTGTVDPGTAF